MGCEQNLRELNVNVISFITISVKREIRDWQFPPFFMIGSEKLVNFHVISREIAKFMWNWRKREIWLRNEVKRDSVNFPWTWIHKAITRESQYYFS